MSARIPALAGILMLSLLCTACLFTNKSKVEYSGKSVRGATLDRLVVGETTKDSLIDEIGEPTSTRKRNGREILEYRSTVKREKQSGFLFLFHNQTSEQEVKTMFFEFREGVLQRHWTE